MEMKFTMKKNNSIIITAMVLQSFVLMFVSNVRSLGSMILHVKQWQYCLLPYSKFSMELMLWETLGVMCHASKTCCTRALNCVEYF